MSKFRKYTTSELEFIKLQNWKLILDSPGMNYRTANSLLMALDEHQTDKTNLKYYCEPYETLMKKLLLKLIM